MATEIRVPTLGESVTEATIGRWFKQPGEAVKADEPVVEPLVGTALEPDWPGVGDDARIGALAATVGESVGEAATDDPGERVAATPAPSDGEPPVLAPA